MSRKEFLSENTSKVIDAYCRFRTAEASAAIDTYIYEKIDDRYEIYGFPYRGYMYIGDKVRGETVIGVFDNVGDYESLGKLIGTYLNLKKKEL